MTLFSKPFKNVFIKKTWLTVCPGGTNFVWTIPIVKKTNVASLITFLPHIVIKKEKENWE
jgi:hypothetical protein